MGLESFAADIPPELRAADELLSRYGRWATSNGSRKGAHTLDRMYIREADRSESLEAWIRRRQHVPADPLMSTGDALAVQRALAAVPVLQRVVLVALYIPNRQPLAVRMAVLRVVPRTSRERHLDGLKMFRNLHQVVTAKFWRIASVV